MTIFHLRASFILGPNVASASSTQGGSRVPKSGPHGSVRGGRIARCVPPGKQMCLFADRLSTDEMKGNQLRLYFSALAYTLIEALRRLGLKDTEWAQAQVNTIRLKLFKIGAMAHLSVRLIVRG